MARHSGHHAKKRFGQNFLHDQNIISKIVHAVESTDNLNLLEIGPGKGALTLPLLRQYGKLHVVEIDTYLADDLAKLCRDYNGLEIHVEDALNIHLRSLSDSPWQLIGNLPYNISTPLIFHFLGQSESIHSMLFMLQDEVVNRICASESTRDYGRLSVMVQSQCEVEKLFTVSPQCFSPVPAVLSAVVRLRPGAEKRNRILNFSIFEALVRDAFNQRRKTLRNALSGILQDLNTENLPVDLGKRAENLSVDAYIDLANAIFLQENQ